MPLPPTYKFCPIHALIELYTKFGSDPYFRVLNQQYRPDDGFETHQGRHSFCVFIRVNYFGETAVKYKEPRSRLGCFSNQPKKF